MVEVLRLRLNFNLMKIFTQVTVRVRETVSKVNIIIVVVEGMSESQRVVLLVRETVPVHLVSQLVLVVADV